MRKNHYHQAPITGKEAEHMKKTKKRTGAVLRAATTGIALAAAITALIIPAGSSLTQSARPVSAKAAEKTITVKPDSDFLLTLPASWKGKYVVEKSKNKKHDSYVSFSAKKCRQEKGDGGLFTILRYKDSSYEDLPSYELVGKWGGLNYVAAFPTETQTYGVSKAAKKQYLKLAKNAYPAAFSIRPAKKRAAGSGVYRTSDFSLKLPAAWEDSYIVFTDENKENGSGVSFCAKKCYEETGEGFLFAISGFTDDSYTELPDYELVGKWNGVSYVASFPTDVQFAGASEEAVKQYRTLEKTARKVARSILR